MSRTELWEAPKGAPLTGHVGFSVQGSEGHETVTIPYTMLASILQSAGLRRKITTHHEPRLSLRPADLNPSDPPRGYRWMTPRECHGSDDYCDRCAPDSPERRVAPIVQQAGR